MPRCAWPKPVPSIAPCARHTALPSARWKNCHPGHSHLGRFLSFGELCNLPHCLRKESRMRTKIQGLSQTVNRNPLVEGLYRARVAHFGPAGHAPNPCVAPTFLILDPAPFAGRYIRTRLYYHDRALWKLRWFLRDFNYDADLLA